MLRLTLTAEGYIATNDEVERRGHKHRVLAASGVAVEATGTLAPVLLASILVPGGTLGKRGSLAVTTLYTNTGSANSKLFQIMYGGQVFVTNAPTTNKSCSGSYRIANRGSLGNQYGHASNSTAGAGAGATAMTELTVDSSVDQYIEIFGSVTLESENLTLQRYIVEILNPQE